MGMNAAKGFDFELKVILGQSVNKMAGYESFLKGWINRQYLTI